jgi:hypothetical protein
MIRHQALVTRFQRRPVSLESVVDDSFFLSEGKRLSQFDVYERITFVPGMAHKEISFPVIFQSIRDGVRCRADAPAGVRLWSEYRVERRRADLGDGVESDEKKGHKIGGVGGPVAIGGGHLASTSGYDGFDNGDEVYDIVEEIVVECNSMLMPFVSRSMEGAHRDLCKKVIDEVVQKKGLRPGSAPLPVSNRAWSHAEPEPAPQPEPARW